MAVITDLHDTVAICLCFLEGRLCGQCLPLTPVIPWLSSIFVYIIVGTLLLQIILISRLVWLCLYCSKIHCFCFVLICYLLWALNEAKLHGSLFVHVLGVFTIELFGVLMAVSLLFPGQLMGLPAASFLLLSPRSPPVPLQPAQEVSEDWRYEGRDVARFSSLLFVWFNS